mmetsp:Transcript_5988/g.18033  ORF Transcript_5988/g.18033 Transcript_5988/m.18033 type:complete len:536 (+) Transcript_5988:102-1709(+)|eukprot:CAMPEP_0198732890 /NCGR_PEP_ID=MMETSP1475-20131203/40665_1 /TAXON_ID= ORGANISM="Unidentified sp., Strain CCMP1999" /NCGR_SAMPLE_ID=MMETSP1475 /ASSEMBLY_ACC=CAM_ASM_001111 /LENGTH=535 /DNA_ID=CAMNT_0044496075 /DNA_START=85 /DNA_END=1692 /DNA_ORIENTATION=+
MGAGESKAEEPISPEKDGGPRTMSRATDKDEGVRMASRGFEKVAAKYGGMKVLDQKNKNILEDYEIGEVLGEGSFGICRLGIDKKTSQRVAIKTISKGKLLQEDNTEDIRNEVMVMKAVANHPNVVNIFGAYEDGDHVHIVLELCSGGDLFERIIEKGKYSEKDCADLCRQMLKMLDHCHSHGVVHRDLKPENFLLHVLGEPLTLKATDFGLSAFIKAGEYLKEPCGTPMYIAPEVIRGYYNHKADVWSAGVVLYILLSGKVPFFGRSDKQILKMTLRGKYNIEKDPWPHISDEAKECVKLMLALNPKDRPDAKIMLEHPWIREDGIASDKPLVESVLGNLAEFNQMSKFKKKALQIMAANMNERELVEVRKAFDEVDSDHSGTITVEEMRYALEKLGNKVGDSELLSMWDTFDLDGNGTIEYEEFLAATADLNKINTADNFRYAFKNFDKDGDGRITVDEVLDALKDIGVEPEHAREIVADADLNSDGVIDFDEFVFMMKEKGNINEACNNMRNKNIKELADQALVQERQTVPV